MSTIRGSVFQDLNGNNIFDPGEGLPNVTVFLDESGDGIPQDVEQITLTSFDGGYAFTDLPEGTVILDQVTPPGFNEPVAFTSFSTGDQFLPLPITVSGDPNEQLDVNVLYASVVPVPPPFVPLTGNIRGSVYIDNNANGVYEPFGELGEPTLAAGFPQADIYIDLNNSGFLESGEPVTTPNEAGFYVFELLPPGEYLIRADLPSGFELVGDQSINDGITTVTDAGIIAPVAAGSVTELDIGVIDPNSIYGRVLRDLNGNGQPDPTEPGQGSIDVTVTDGNGRERTATTNDDGFYKVSGLDTAIPGEDDPQNPFAQYIAENDPGRFAGSFVVDFGTPSSAYLFTSPVPPVGAVPGELGVTLTAGESRQVNSTLVFNTTGVAPVPNSISGVVFNDQNADSLLDFDPVTGLFDGPVAGATVYLDLDEDGELGDDEPNTTTDFNGNFIFRDLPATLPIDPVTGLASLEESYILRVEPTDDLGNLTTPVPAYTLDFGEAAQGTIGLSSLVPFPPENQFALPGGGIDTDNPIRVRGFDPGAVPFITQQPVVV